MSSKTKIVVLHMKELIYTGIFVLLGILFIILLVIMFLPDKEKPKSSTETLTETGVISGYIPGVYTTSLTLNNHTVDVEVVVDESSITSVRLINLDEAVATMYPLIQPSFDSIALQLQSGQSLDTITYEPETKYTTLVLLDAVRSCLEKASLPAETVSENN